MHRDVVLYYNIIMPDATKKKQKLAALILAVIGIVIFANALPNKMFWDDDDGIIKNAYIQDGRFLPKYFSENMIAGAGLSSNYWRPALLVSYALEWRVWQNWPPGFHATNIIIHIINAILVFYLLWRLFKNWLLSFLPALFFLIHPLQTEAVTYVSGRADPMYALFTLLALIFYLKSKKKKLSAKQSRRYRLLPPVFFILALMSKETAIVLPGLVLLVDVFLWYKSQQFLKKSAGWQFVKTETKRLAPFIAIAMAYLLLRAAVLRWTGSFAPYQPSAAAATSNIAINFFTFFRTLADYVWLIAWPNNLHMERTLAIAASFWNIRAAAGLILTIAMTALAIRCRQKRPEYVFAVGLFWIGLARLVPLLADTKTTRGLAYEHWLYLAQIGFWLLIALLIRDIINPPLPEGGSGGVGERRHLSSVLVRNSILLLLIFLVLNFSVRTILRNRAWRDPITFYNDVLKYNKGSLRVWNNLGMAYAEAGEYQKAIDSYQTAMKLDTRGESAPPYHNIANSYKAMGDFDKAIDNYEKALAVDPEFIFSYRALAALYLENKELDKARLALRRAAAVFPENEEIQYYLRNLPAQ